jgi:hypothetical protein
VTFSRRLACLAGTPRYSSEPLVFGESSDPAAPNYLDQANLYAKRKFKPAWFSLDEIKAHAYSVYHPGQNDEWAGLCASAQSRPFVIRHLTSGSASSPRRLIAREVNEATLDVGADEFDTNAVTHIETLESPLEPSFDWKLAKSHPRSLRRGAGNEGVELLAHPARQEQRGR